MNDFDPANYSLEDSLLDEEFKEVFIYQLVSSSFHVTDEIASELLDEYWDKYPRIQTLFTKQELGKYISI
jgi:hypothetical protein